MTSQDTEQDSPKTSDQTPKGQRKTLPRHHPDTRIDTPKTAERQRTPIPESNPSVSLSTNPSVSLSGPTEEAQLSSPEAQLGEATRRELERRQKSKVAAELLESGYSVRETASELDLPKAFVEKISKQARRERPTDARQKYLARPFELANEKFSEADEEEGQSLLESGWLEKTQRKIWKLKIEQQMMRQAGLIGGDGENSGGSKINLQEILLAKIVASGGTTGAQELASFAASLKSLFAQPAQTQPDPLDTFAKLQQIENQGVEKFSQLQTRAFEVAKSQVDRGFVKELVEKAVDVGQKILVKPSPPPLPPLPTEIPAPMPIENLSLEPQLEAVGPVENFPVIRNATQVPLENSNSIGYSNLRDPYRAKR